MKVRFILLVFIITGCLSCANQPSEKKATAEAVGAPIEDTRVFTLKTDQDTVVQNGESVTKYKNGQIKMQGMMKDGKREGLWKSFYENGLPWSETTFKAGIRDGKTVTWFENGQKRYVGSYANDLESGKWTYWDEHGKEIATRDFDKK